MSGRRLEAGTAALPQEPGTSQPPACQTLEPGAEPYPAPADYAWIVGWVALLVAAVLIDYWLRKRTNLSRGLQRTSRRFRWFGALVLGVLFVAGWHFVFGGPL